MEKEKGIYFPSQWMDYLNQAPEFKKRVSKDGASPSLEGKDIIALDLEGLPKPWVISLKNGKFSIKEKEAKESVATIKMPLSSFLKLAHPEARVVWSLMDDNAQFSVAKGTTWPEIVTIFEMLVAIQELVDKKPELIAA
mgnify:CR=1 FL=1